MNENNVLKQPIFHIGIMILGFVGLTLLSLFLWPTSAAYADLPERPEIVEPPVAETDDPAGGQIVLVVTAELAGGEWAAVEWYDSNTEAWYPISNDGWQGELAADGRQIWWVGPELYGKGPFRWQVYEEKEGNLLYTSEEFSMPASKNKIVTVTISAVSE